MAGGLAAEVQASPPALAADFVISAARAGQFPEPGLPELALLGRSNSGKSSLLNRWLGRKALARVGATPGRTRLINFFEVTWRKDLSPFLLADLPGYGYAAAPKAMVAGWRRLVGDYLESRRPLKMALLMMDVRRDPGADEFGLLNWLDDLSIPAWLIATKIDKLAPAERTARLKKIDQKLKDAISRARAPLGFSAQSGQGREQLIETLVNSGLLWTSPSEKC